MTYHVTWFMWGLKIGNRPLFWPTNFFLELNCIGGCSMVQPIFTVRPYFLICLYLRHIPFPKKKHKIFPNGKIIPSRRLSSEKKSDFIPINLSFQSPRIPTSLQIRKGTLFDQLLNLRKNWGSEKRLISYFPTSCVFLQISLELIFNWSFFKRAW